MTEPRCDRPYRHPGHDYVDDAGVDRRCPGTKTEFVLPQLIAERPALSGVGLIPKVLQMGVESA